MANIGKTVTSYLAEQLQSTTGINAALAMLRTTDSQSPGDIRVFTLRNITAELLEKSNQALYPAVLVYCEKLSNTLLEKFRTFSGRARLSVELRNSADRLEGLDSTLVYMDVICGVLNTMRGEWISGVFYNGGYEIVYSPAREGGRHFLQSAKLSLELDISE